MGGARKGAGPHKGFERASRDVVSCGVEAARWTIRLGPSTPPFAEHPLELSLPPAVRGRDEEPGTNPRYPDDDERDPEGRRPHHDLPRRAHGGEELHLEEVVLEVPVSGNAPPGDADRMAARGEVPGIDVDGPPLARLPVGEPGVHEDCRDAGGGVRGPHMEAFRAG